MAVSVGACGDSGGDTATDSATAGASTTAGSATTTGELPTTGSASEVVPTTGSSVSESDGTTATTDTTGMTGMTTMGVSDSDTTTTGVTSTGPDETTAGTTAAGPEFCGDAPPPGFVGDFDSECKNEPQVGTFDPVLEWTRSTWTDAPTSNQIMVQPIVAPLTDDDEDGVYGSAGDMPAVLVVSFVGTAWTSVGVIRAISGDGTKDLFTISGQGIGGASAWPSATWTTTPRPRSSL